MGVKGVCHGLSVATCAIEPKVDCNTPVKSQRSEEREMAVRGF